MSNGYRLGEYCYQTVVYKERDKNLSGAGSLTKIKDNRWQGAA